MVSVVSWNINERQPGAPAKWDYLKDVLAADLALVQEAIVPADLPAAARAGGIAGRDGKSRRWGSAVVAFSDRVRITPVGLAEGVWRGNGQGVAPLDSVSRGHVAVARVELADFAFTAVSAYGLMEFGYASGTLLRTLADLEPLLDDPGLGTDVLLAGDWNIGTWWTGADAKYATRESAVLRLLEAYGFEDCLDQHRLDQMARLERCPCDLAECRHIETYRKPGSPYAYMDDYMYATPSLAARITSAGVAAEWDWQPDLSDHAPLRATIRPA